MGIRRRRRQEKSKSDEIKTPTAKAYVNDLVLRRSTVLHFLNRKARKSSARFWQVKSREATKAVRYNLTHKESTKVLPQGLYRTKKVINNSTRVGVYPVRRGRSTRTPAPKPLRRRWSTATRFTKLMFMSLRTTNVFSNPSKNTLSPFFKKKANLLGIIRKYRLLVNAKPLSTNSKTKNLTVQKLGRLREQSVRQNNTNWGFKSSKSTPSKLYTTTNLTSQTVKLVKKTLQLTNSNSTRLKPFRNQKRRDFSRGVRRYTKLRQGRFVFRKRRTSKFRHLNLINRTKVRLAKLVKNSLITRNISRNPRNTNFPRLPMPDKATYGLAFSSYKPRTILTAPNYVSNFHEYHVRVSTTNLINPLLYSSELTRGLLSTKNYQLMLTALNILGHQNPVYPHKVFTTVQPDRFTGGVVEFNTIRNAKPSYDEQLTHNLHSLISCSSFRPDNTTPQTIIKDTKDIKDLSNQITAQDNAIGVFDAALFVEFSTNRKLAASPKSAISISRLSNKNADFYSSAFTDSKHANAYKDSIYWKRLITPLPQNLRAGTFYTPGLFLPAHGQTLYRLKRLSFEVDERKDCRFFSKIKTRLVSTPNPLSVDLSFLTARALTLVLLPYQLHKNSFTWRTRSQIRKFRWKVVVNFFKTTDYLTTPKRSYLRRRLLRSRKKLFKKLRRSRNAKYLLYRSLRLPAYMQSNLVTSKKQTYYTRDSSNLRRTKYLTRRLRYRLRRYIRRLQRMKYLSTKDVRRRSRKIQRFSTLSSYDKRTVFYDTNVNKTLQVTPRGRSTTGNLLTRAPETGSSFSAGNVHATNLNPQLWFMRFKLKQLTRGNIHFLLNSLTEPFLWNMRYNPASNPSLKLTLGELRKDILLLEKQLPYYLNGASQTTSLELTNLLPHKSFQFIVNKKLINFFANQRFRTNIVPWYYNTLVRFIEEVTGKRALIQFYPFIHQTLEKSAFVRYRRWLPRLSFYERSLGHRFFLEEAIHIMHLSFSLKDISLFGSWLKAMILRISFWKTRSIFRFLRYLMHHYFRHVFATLGIQGIKIKLKGKISAAGNSRKRTILYRVGRTSHSSVDLRISYESFLINTFTGVMGFQVWLFY